jgi:putative effector of murein hydrolase LrgA (UPF0299 family)
MAQAGTISAAEAARLHQSLHAESTVAPATHRGAILANLHNPYLRFGGGVGAAAGLGLAALSVWCRPFCVRFDGFIDLHRSREPGTLKDAIIEQLASVLLPSIVFYGLALALRCKARWVDFVAMTALARLPFLFAVLPIALIDAPVPEPGVLPTITVSLLLSTASSLMFVAWAVVWLYQGFKNASGLRDSRLVGSFLAGAFASELLSKVVLIIANHS